METKLYLGCHKGTPLCVLTPHQIKDQVSHTKVALNNFKVKTGAA